ncbi:uncharacterized protein LOC132336589 [Haemorhous mexicanus]|uniref:uncharacterized protein LOC132336589 n=1 Tax=Haemorhous mexicanus TaxID=30427 RepID=UPI0028BEF9C8|nr:uncharacterized protein LOC132336589 [Haemorhous mexicanus]
MGECCTPMCGLGAGILCIPSGIWGTLCPTTVSCTLSPPVGLGCSVPDGNGGTLHCTVPSLLCLLCQDGIRMLRVPHWNGGTQHRASRALSPAGTLLIPSGNRDCATCTPSPPGRDTTHSRRGCVSGLVSAVCLQSAPEPRAAGPGASPSLEKGERERREPEPGSAARRAAAAAGLGRDSSPGGHGDMARLLPLLLLAALGCAARPGRRPAAGDDGALAQRPPARGCANLTLVLDNWKFAITSQLRNLLLSDHQTVLPDYGRIPALSGALDELYRDFRGLKEQLGRLSDRFAHLEASVEQLSRARGAAAPPRRGGVPQSPRRVPGTPQ